MHDYDKIAAIVGEDKINALREAGVEITDKSTKPTTGLLGRWAKDIDDENVLILSDEVNEEGEVSIAYPGARIGGIADIAMRLITDLTFPEETTRPEDVPVGEAWLVNAEGEVGGSAERAKALKVSVDCWALKPVEKSTVWEFENSEVTLVAPLVPARPVGNKPKKSYWAMQAEADKMVRECMSEIDKRSDEEAPETVTTEEEYATLPDGSIVAQQGSEPYIKVEGNWYFQKTFFNDREMREITRTVLRKGWGEQPVDNPQ